MGWDLHSDEGCYVEAHVDTRRTNYLDIGSLEPHNFAWILAGICVAFATIISCHLTLKHLRNYTKPEHQKHIVRIILIVPIYGIDSFLSFRFYWISVYFDVIRDCYEAFVIYTFYSLLIEFVGGYQHGKEIFSKRSKFKLALPLCCIEIHPKRGLLRQCKRLTLQYVVIRPVMTIFAVILHSAREFCPGNYSPLRGYVYFQFVNFWSVTIAMYALVLFYSVSKDDIAKYKPIPKFLSVKLIIFLSFWQCIIIAGFVYIHGIEETTYWTTENIATGVQNALLCLEMLIAAIWHTSAFAWREFDTGKKTPVLASAANAFSPHDIAQDIYFSFFPKKKKAAMDATKGFVDLEKKGNPTETKNENMYLNYTSNNAENRSSSTELLRSATDERDIEIAADNNNNSSNNYGNNNYDNNRMTHDYSQNDIELSHQQNHDENDDNY